MTVEASLAGSAPIRFASPKSWLGRRSIEFHRRNATGVLVQRDRAGGGRGPADLEGRQGFV
ncbi:hypothetical protein XFF6992_110004 [Xanthomonas citri pv. fuscans]|nr:hypothetical protein XFF6990_250004 [Xanthomonas citri pv. fuscans]SOO17018.1 hypothetical protein XFF6992_110004 [Xanthomonas citri pv. fuscans]SOO35407.1 hypothetical protein XFF6994_530004 [Xanthomonas citri pv. fuscans]